MAGARDATGGSVLTRPTSEKGVPDRWSSERRKVFGCDSRSFESVFLKLTLK
jgi:hypothetical protein